MSPQAPKGRSRLSRIVVWVSVAALLLYVAVMLGPYLRSILVRDAAVTSWINIATSPIYGEVGANLPRPGQRVGSDGVIAEVRNIQADRSALDVALARAARATAIADAAARRLADLETLRSESQRTYERYRSAYLKELEAEAAGIARRLEAAERERARMERFAGQRDGESLTDTIQQIAGLEAERDKLEIRRQAAEADTILLDDGSDPDWGQGLQHRLDDALAAARYADREALADAEAAAAEAAAAESEYRKTQKAAVLAPAGALLWSTIVGEGAAVDVGTPVASWIDCGQLLVDVPMADAEIALLEVGSPATVILEGDPRELAAEVLLTRGSAATIKGDDLAALAKGRREGVAQALLRLHAGGEDEARCPVGHAAYVDFPEVGILDVLRARLRL